MCIRDSHRVVGDQDLASAGRFRCDRVCFPKNQPVRAETNAVCVAQLSPVDFLLVHECAVGAGQIFEKQDLLHLDDPRMVGGDSEVFQAEIVVCLLYTSPSPRDRTRSRMPSSA